MQAALPNIGKGSWKLIKGSGKIQQQDNPVSLITNLSYGENIFEWKVPANSCNTDSTSAIVKVQRSITPAKPVITQPSADSLTCSIAATSYEWFVDNVALNISAQKIAVSQSGKYTLRATIDKCSSALSDPFNFEKITTGVEKEEIIGVKIYPNPTTGVITFSVNQFRENVLDLFVMDAFGRQLLTRSLKVNSSSIQEQVDLAIFGKGIYIIKLQGSQGMAIHKVFVH